MQLTRILDNLRDADGNPAQGKLVIHNEAFIAFDGSAIAASNLTYVIPPTSPGLVDLLLVPTGGADPSGTAYAVKYFLKSGAEYSETWHISLSGPITVSQARA
jgi:hypothetical protein